METVTLKSRVGPLSFTRRTFVTHESGKTFYEVRTYEFNNDNGCKMAVPQQVWAELSGEFLDSKTRLRYRDALIPQ
jgi:hypothetical protein